MTTKNNIFKEHLKKWLSAKGDKKKRSEIIDHICFVTDNHRKSIPRSFKRIQMRGSNTTEKRGRKIFYTPDVTCALKDIWETSSESCAENLHSILPEYINILSRDKMWKHSPEVTKKLLAMSLGTMKKRLGGFTRMKFLTRGKSSTRKGAIHTLIPMRTGPWGDSPIGTLQLDTVAHCGDTLIGDFVFTVNCTDVTTLWGSRRAQWNKGQIETVKSMEKMNSDIPFPILEWHPDSGSEFINWHCKGWCDKKKQKLTRSRPSKKNDNCFVEERNGHIVRRWVGYTRLDVDGVVNALNEVYDVLTPYTNHFVATRRVLKKERIGARWKITREKVAKTPYQRVLERTDVDDTIKEELKSIHEKLNPLTLKNEIDNKLKILFKIQKHRGITESN